MILPRPAHGFEWRDFEGRPGLVCRPLEQVAPHVFTTSAWPIGVRAQAAGSGDPWEAVARAVGVEPSALARMHQVHGIAAVLGRRSTAPPHATPALPEADIVIIGDEGVAGAIQVADCVPVLLADRGRGVVAAAHAGWRGLAADGPRAAIDALARTFGTSPADVVAALGPSIGACCYEVGLEVRERFALAGYPERTLARWFLQRPAVIDGNPAMPRVAQAVSREDRWYFDGWAAARDQLVAAGVGASQIFGARLCTASHPDVFCSYRRDGSPSGRLAGAIRCGRARLAGRA